jgi:hypothetical protein
VAQCTKTLTTGSEAMGDNPIVKTELCDVNASLPSFGTDGQVALRGLVLQGRSPERSRDMSVPEALELRCFGMLVMLAGGVEACKSTSGIPAVKEAVLVVYHTTGLAGRTEQQRRADVMGLCKMGEPTGQMIYALGKAGEWTGASADQQRKWRADIIAAADAVCARPCVCLRIIRQEQDGVVYEHCVIILTLKAHCGTLTTQCVVILTRKV